MRALSLIFLSLASLSPAMGILPGPEQKALDQMGLRFRAGDLSGAAAVAEPWLTRSAAVGRQALALRFLMQDLSGTAALGALWGPKSMDDEARLWVARAEGGRGNWKGALAWLDSLSLTARPLALVLRAEAYQAQGSTLAASAMELALSATTGTRLSASTAMVAAEAAAARGDAKEAERLYKRAEKADGSYTMVNARLAALYRGGGRLDDARIRLQKARQVDPDDDGLRQALNHLLEEQPNQAVALKKEEEDRSERFLLRQAPSVTATARVEGEPLVRVGLLEKAARFDLVLGGAYAVEGERLDSQGGLTLAAQSTWRVQLAQGGGWEMAPLSPTVGTALRFARALSLRPLDASSTFGLHGVANGAGYFWARQEDRYYRGIAELRPQGAEGLTLVNVLGMEAYLLSVVPSEIRAHWSPEALKAQAVAARTEAWRTLGRFKARGYDLCPTVLCAAYAGVREEDPRTSYAVTATAGLVLENRQGKLSPTFYMHNSGGHTQEPGEAWSGAVTDERMATVDAPEGSGASRYFPVSPASLLAFIDDLDGDVPAWPRASGTFRWTLRLSAAELADAVGRRHRQVLPLRRVLSLERSAGGYVRRVLFDGAGGTSVASSDRVRPALHGVKSNLLYVEARYSADGTPQAWLIHGGGWGHGVGMSQAGAKAMAEAGLNHRAILRHYFRGTRLQHRYSR